MSQHECPVIEVKLEKHPNADTLSIVKIDGYMVCVRTEDWANRKLGVYIPPDYVVDSNLEQFNFLGLKPKKVDGIQTDVFIGGPQRIKVKKLRGVVSHGLLMPAPEDAQAGEDYMEKWGIIRWEAPETVDTGGEAEGAPHTYAPKYDVESIRKYNTLIQEGEDVVITEKLNGCNSRYTFSTGKDDPTPRMYCGSRNEWKRAADDNLWWNVLQRFPQIESWCRSHPGMVLYGEIFGQVKGFNYGAAKGERLFRAFDILREGQWVNWEESQRLIAEVDSPSPILWAPVVFVGPFSMAAAEEYALQDSLVPGAKHMREGIVVKPIIERQDFKAGRVSLKLVSDRYLAA